MRALSKGRDLNKLCSHIFWMFVLTYAISRYASHIAQFEWVRRILWFLLKTKQKQNKNTEAKYGVIRSKVVASEPKTFIIVEWNKHKHKHESCLAFASKCAPKFIDNMFSGAIRILFLSFFFFLFSLGISIMCKWHYSFTWLMQKSNRITIWTLWLSVRYSTLLLCPFEQAASCMNNFARNIEK